MRLQGLRILVTGAYSCLGRACARRFALEGAEVILSGRDPAALEETLPGAGQAVMDHSDDAAVAAYAATCPPLDGLFLCAGRLLTGTVEGSPVSTFDALLQANLRGPWLMAHHLGPRLRDGASVVLVGSNIGIRAVPDSAAYCVSKAGVHMLAQVLALEWAPRGIRCNAMAPGPVHTPMVEARLATVADREARLEHLRHTNPMGRMGREEEIAALAAHLLSRESAWTTGAILPIDGGATAVF